MGNDGGSIAKRDDLVKTKAKKAIQDPKNALVALWTTCALSKRPLAEPVVTCPLGKLYNKLAILEYLLQGADNQAFGADGRAVAGHLRNIKDVLPLILTRNPNLASSTTKSSTISEAAQAGAEQSVVQAHFICPLSQRELNGAVRFIVIKACRHVVAEAAYKDLQAALAKSNAHSQSDDQGQGGEMCGVCNERHAPDTLVLNSTNPQEVEALAKSWEAVKATEAAAKDAKKRSRKAAALESGREVEERKGGSNKKAKVLHAATPPSAAAADGLGGGAPRLPASVAAALNQARLKPKSDAVKALYGDGKEEKTQWMVSGTFTRYA